MYMYKPPVDEQSIIISSSIVINVLLKNNAIHVYSGLKPKCTVYNTNKLFSKYKGYVFILCDEAKINKID